MNYVEVNFPCAYRNINYPDIRYDYNGFRCVVRAGRSSMTCLTPQGISRTLRNEIGTLIRSQHFIFRRNWSRRPRNQNRFIRSEGLFRSKREHVMTRNSTRMW